jgi:glyoxylase-like metal-dependent hydrolase (beta-lactamase superfamily II)
VADVRGLPVADPWWAVERVGDGVTLVSEPHVHRFLRCNVWRVEGRDLDLVIDTALGLSPLRAVVDRGADTAVLAVATHAHADHIGGMHEFDRRAIHRAEADELAAGSVATVATDHYGDTSVGTYRRAGHEFGTLLVDAVPPGAPAGHSWPVVPAPATRLLGEGDVVDLGDRAFEVLHLPGHTAGSIGLWEPATGILFSGDAVYDGPLLDELDGSDVDAYVTTMQRLRQLPVTVVHGGHEASFGRDRLQAICDDYLRRRG